MTNKIIKGKTEYTIQKINRDDNFYGPIHGSNDIYAGTICGDKITMDGKWFVLTNSFDGQITCPKCIQYIKAVIK